jgi:hypothetical protein
MMAEDVEVEWTPFTREQQRFYSNSGAATLGFNWGVAFFTGILLLASIAAAVSPRWQSQLKRIAGTGAIVGLLVAAIIFFAIDKTAVRLVHSPRMRTIQNVRVLGYFFAAEAGSNFLSVAEARALIKSLPEKDKDKVLFGHRTLENLLLGGSIREEDSPGNYVLRPSGNDVEFIWFDADGAEHGLER